MNRCAGPHRSKGYFETFDNRMGVDHCHPRTIISQQFLNRTDAPEREQAELSLIVDNHPNCIVIEIGNYKKNV